MIEIILAGLLGLIVGFFISKALYQKEEIKFDNSSLNTISRDLVEIKEKFKNIEKEREQKDKHQQELNKQYEERIKDWMQNSNKFIAEQKESTEKFLKSQGATHEEIEQKRDAQMNDMKKLMSSFVSSIKGTKRAGIVGEELLKEVLSNSIRAGVIKTNLKTDNGNVEFAWNLEDGHYIPIDSKLPEVYELLEEYNTTENHDIKHKLKKQIVEKVKKQIKEVTKYQNLSNTVDACLLVIPEGILEISPELVGMGKEHSVFVCSYKEVFPISQILQEQHIRMKEEGDIGKYKKIVDSLFLIIEKIYQKTDSIEKAVKTISNANDDIKQNVVKAKNQKNEN